MKTLAFTGALMTSLLMATALTPVRAADMTYERALNVDKEPQNWLLHHGNYQGHRFSRAQGDQRRHTSKNLKPGVHRRARRLRRAAARYAFGNLEAHADRRGRHDVRHRRLGLGLRDRRHRAARRA